MELKLSSTIKSAVIELGEDYIGEVNVYCNPDSTINNIVVKVKTRDKTQLIAYFNATKTRFNVNFDFSNLQFDVKTLMLRKVFEVTSALFEQS